MERRRHRQRQRALRALGLQHLAGPVDPGLGAGDDGLLRVVEIHRLDGFAGRGATSAQPARTACGVHAEDRRHRADADRHGLLHRLGAKAHQRQRIGQSAARRRRPARSIRPANARPRRSAAARSRPARRDSRRCRRSASPAGCWSSGRAAPSGPRGSGGAMSSPSASDASASVCRTAGWSPQASSMPTACEPWPGNTNANVVIVCARRLSSRAAPRPR